MDKIEKFLLKLSKKDRQTFVKIFKDILILNLENYDVKTIKEYKDFYRLRKGKIRIIFIKRNNQGLVINIAYRKDIYKEL